MFRSSEREQDDPPNEPFQYGPLDLDRPAFRLLRILKGRGWVVSCELFSAYLTEGNERQEAISYEALSYVWGTTERGLKYIEVNGRQFQITNNLHEALQRLRLEDEDRIIWVDAVCIDQDNEKERGHQVRHMGDIYKKADRVLYWLGLSTYETEFCLGALKTLQEASRSVAHSQWTLVRWANFWQSLDTGYCNRPSLQREGLRILCDRPWFRRVWILQEVAKSRAAEVYCGKSSVSARMFSLAPFLMGFQPGTHVQAIFDMMPGPFRKDSWFGKNTGLYTLLMNFGGAEAKDSRDLVYALLGMSSDGINDILPDYGRSEEDLMKILAHYFFHVDLDLFPASNMPSTMREFCTRLPEMSKVALEIAAGMEKSGDEIAAALLQKYPTTEVTQVAAKAAASNGPLGRKLMDMLLHQLETTTPWKKQVTQSWGLLEAASGNEMSGDDIAEILLNQTGYNFQVTENVLAAAVENRSKGMVLLELFDRRSGNSGLPVTDKVIEAAARNDACGDEIVSKLMKSRGTPYVLTEPILRSVARNTTKGPSILRSLLAGDDEAKATTPSMAELQPTLTWVATLDGGLSAPLFRKAIQEQNLAVMKQLLRWLPVDGTGPQQSLVPWASRYSLDAVKMLMNHGVNIHGEDITLFNPTGIANAAICGQASIVEFLIKQGAEVESKNIYGETPLHLAAKMGWTNVASVLLDPGRAQVDSRDNGLYTPLMRALFDGHEEVADALVTRFQADVNARSGFGETPLFAAVESGMQSAVELLIRYHANVRYSTERGKTALWSAADRGRLGIVKVLLAHGAVGVINKVCRERETKTTPLYRAAMRGYTEVARTLIEHGADVHLTDCLIGSVDPRWGTPEMKRLFLKHGAIRDAKDASRRFWG